MAFYYDQHLAWQQRVSKEVTAASKFLSQYQPVVKSTPKSATKVSITPTSQTAKQFYNTTDSKMSGVYAEVRGKYARPPPLMQKSQQYDILAPKENNLVGRPSTSGSLKPRSASGHRHLHSSGKKVEENEASPIRPRIFKYRSTSTHCKRDEMTLPEKVRRLVEEKPEDADDRKDKEEAEKTKENENEDIEENQDAVEELRENPQYDGLSNMSGITTSSQRRYIQELESMLRQEKLKRIQIEETLKKVLDNKD